MSSYEAEKRDEQLYKMTGIPLAKREEYMQWLGRQNEAVIVMIMEKKGRRYFVQRKKSSQWYEPGLISTAALIETIALYCESDKEMDEIDFNVHWFKESHIKNVRRSLAYLR